MSIKSRLKKLNDRVTEKKDGTDCFWGSIDPTDGKETRLYIGTLYNGKLIIDPEKKKLSYGALLDWVV